MTMDNDSGLDPAKGSRNSSNSRAQLARDAAAIDQIPLADLVNNNTHNHIHHCPDLKNNSIAEKRISGILHKWVNYGKGWRPRWFVLHDGVVSYYKIHGPDKVFLSEETLKGSRLIGLDFKRQFSSQKSSYHHNIGSSRKPVGEIHLKVSSIRENGSDERRFSIFSGTKKLHLRAESREDRVAWMEALQAAKDLFPRLSNSELMSPIDDPTEKLRLRLLEEGVSDAAVQDTEEIMKREFAPLQNELSSLKQKYWLLMDTLRQLETEKAETPSESADEKEMVDAAEEDDTGSEEATFFDTKDQLLSTS